MCPRCGQQIPVDEMAEHMKIELLDPKYAQQRQLMFDRMKSTSAATDQEVSQSLSAFASRRTDIFGSEEVEIGKSVDHSKEPQREEKTIWDGHTASIARTTTAAAVKALEEQKNLSKAPRMEEKSGIGPDIPSQQPPLPPPPKVFNLDCFELTVCR